MKQKIAATLTSLLFCLAAAAVGDTLAVSLPDNPGIVKGTVTARAADGQQTTVADAVVSLTPEGKTASTFTAKTDQVGAFVIENIPLGKYTLRVESTGLSTVTREITIGSGSVLVVDVNLSVDISEQVTVRNEEGLLSTDETSTSNIVLATTLQNQPLRSDEYQSALPLTPGVVRANDNSPHIKGARSSQSRFTLNGADVNDPISGSPSFEIPLEAINNIKIEDNAYTADLGQFTGGVAQLNTKGGSNKWDGRVSRLFPTYGGFFTGKIESFRPRVWVSGPIIKDKLFFVQSFEYRFRREESSDLPEGEDFRKVERFTSYTQLDYVLNKSNQLKLNFALYPQKTRFANLNFFTPQTATYNLKQRGYLVNITEQAVFGKSFLNSSFYFLKADVDIFGQGGADFTYSPEGVSGDYFGTSYRDSDRWRLQETFYVQPVRAVGKHSIQIGAEFSRVKAANDLRFDPILFRRLDGTLTQRIDFSAEPEARTTFTEAGFFVQDKWDLNDRLTLDLGARIDHDGVTGDNNFSPRATAMITPFASKKTIIRLGAGLFYDRTLPIARMFASDGNLYPQRSITFFAPDGVTPVGTETFVNRRLGELDTPRSTRWSVYLDQGITDDLTFRVGYVDRQGSHDLLIDRVSTGPLGGEYLLSSNGTSRYREFQFLLNYTNEKLGKINASYVHSNAEGDLNTADVVANNFAAMNLRPNEFGPFPFDTPHRFLIYGQFPAKWDILISPHVEYRTGYPFSAVNDRLEYVGERGEAGRFPDYLSLDLQVTKAIKFKIPIIKKQYRLRVGAAFFNLTGRFNPRDVQNNVNSPLYGSFYNSLGFGTKLQMFLEL